MQKLIIILLVATFIGNFNAYPDSDGDNETKNILILFSLIPTTPAYRTILDGIRQKLTEEYGADYRLHQEYLETDRSTDESFQSERFKLYNEKYRNLNIDLLIVVGVNIIPTVKKYASKYLLELPTVSLDYDFSNYGFQTDISLNNKTALLALKLNAEKSIATALDLFPNTETVYFICGSSIYDKLFLEISKKAAEKAIKDKNVIFITDIIMDDLLREVKLLPVKSIIFIPNFIRDSKMIPYFNPETIRLVSRESNRPVFNYNDTGFGDGSIGGYVISFEKVGPLTGEVAVKILNGADPNSIKIDETDYYSYQFDWRELKKWNIETSEAIPEGSIIKFEQVNFLNKNKWLIGAALLFMVLQSLLIANLIRLNRNQKLMTNKLIESEGKYREFLHVDRSLRLGQLTASLSHELNQPFTAILSTAQAGINFINSNEATPELLKQLFQKIAENDKRGASILSSIRGMMKLETRQKGKIDLNKLIEEIAAVFHSEASKLNIKLEVELTDKPAYVLADGVQIQQVLLNFILNASQAMEKVNNSNKKIIISNKISSGDVIVAVQDSGKGIDESEKEKLFKPFITSKKEGTGVGLVICRSIIEDHDGKIWAENIPDGGAKFSFSLRILMDESEHKQNL
jgi:signal transduction histidine kinase